MLYATRLLCLLGLHRRVTVVDDVEPLGLSVGGIYARIREHDECARAGCTWRR